MQEAGAKSTAQALRGEIREAKTQLELKLVRAIKGSTVKRDTYRYNMGPQVDRRHSSDRQHRKGWSNQHHFLQELSHVNHAPWPLHVSAQAEKRRALWDQCTSLHAFKPMESGGGDSRVLILLASVILRVLSITYRTSWQAGEAPDDCKKVNITHLSKIRATRRVQGTVEQLDLFPQGNMVPGCALFFLAVPRVAGTGHLVLKVTCARRQLC